jgi:rubrerythrin
MNIKTRQRLGGGLIAVILIVATGTMLWKWQPKNAEVLDTKTFWICRNEFCNNRFSLTIAKYSEYTGQYYGQPMQCPNCGQANVVRAIRCEGCGKYYPMQRKYNQCPGCGRKQYK